MYIVLMYIVLMSSTFTFISVKSVVWRVETKERIVTKIIDDNNNSTLKPKFKRLQPRTISHG